MTGPINATTVATNPGAIEHGEMSFLGINPGGFVALSMIVVLAILFWKGAFKAIGDALDKKIGAIRAQLDEASKLRAEAEALRAEYQARSAAAQTEAEQILTHARAEAGMILAKAKDDAEALIQRLPRLALQQPAVADGAAIAEVRPKAAVAPTAAAAAVIAERNDPENDRELVDKAIAGLGQRLN